MYVRRQTRFPLAVIRLAGSEQKMGEQHGEIIKSLGGYEASLGFYPRMVEKLLRSGLPADRTADLAMAALRPVIGAGLNRLHAARPTQFRDRTSAFFRAGGVPAEEERYLMVMDVFQNLVAWFAKTGLIKRAPALANVSPPACSTVMAWGDSTCDGRMLHGRNFDFPGAGVWDEAPTVVFCTPDDGLRYGFISTRGADVPGISAFNEAGICLTFHTRLHRDVAFRGMSATDLGHEMIRKCRTVADAIRIAAGHPVASTWGIAVSSAAERRAVVIETTASGTEVFEVPDQPWSVCTNHYFAPSMQADEIHPTAAWGVQSVNRLVRIDEVCRAAAEGEGLDPAAIGRLLGDHVDPDDPSRSRAAGSILAQGIGVKSIVFDPERQSVWVSAGPAPTGWGPYAEIPWRWTDEPGHSLPSNPPATRVEEERHGLTGGRELQHGDRARAFNAWMIASRMHMDGAAPEEIYPHLAACALNDPEDPSYRFVLGAVSLQLGEVTTAVEHFEAGAQHELGGFRKAQHQLWAARSHSALGNHREAAALRRAIAGASGPYTPALRAEAAADDGRRYTRRKLTKTVPNYFIVDAAF